MALTWDLGTTSLGFLEWYNNDARSVVFASPQIAFGGLEYLSFCNSSNGTKNYLRQNSTPLNDVARLLLRVAYCSQVYEVSKVKMKKISTCLKIDNKSGCVLHKFSKVLLLHFIKDISIMENVGVKMMPSIVLSMNMW